MADVDSILKDVLKDIRPSPEEKTKINNAMEHILGVCNPIVKEFNAKAMICGSSVKNTWLSGRNEFDLFILFPSSLPHGKLKEFGLTVAKEIIKNLKGTYKIAYAEHPYLRGKVKLDGANYDMDIVPAFDVPDPAKLKSAVDRTPHHVNFVKHNLQLPDEARLLKRFIKGAGVYGADVKTQGFSGYLCELLSINYGRFKSCVKEAANWRAPVVISINGKIGKEEAFKKFNAPLIVIDPVDPNRNVAAAVSVESFYRFVGNCRNFMKSPSKNLFFPDKIKPYTLLDVDRELKRRGTRWYMIKFDRPDIIDDTLWPQMRKLLGTLETKLNDGGFKVLRKDVWADEESCIIAIEMDTWLVPRIMKNVGPSVYSKHAEDFLKHYNDYAIFIEGENWIVEKEREYITAHDLLKNLFKGSQKELQEKGIPNRLTENMAKCRIASGEDILKIVGELPPEFRMFMKDWFEKDINLF